MASDERSLFAQVIAAPDDDTPRLVYADFLSSNGDPRGEFITLQCRLAASPDDEARRVLRIAENKLLKAHAAEWSAAVLNAVTRGPYDGRTKVEFHRGFIEKVDVPLSALDDLETLFEVAPLIRSLQVDSPPFLGQTLQPPTLAKRLSSPRLLGVRSLELRVGAAGDGAALELAASAQLRGLTALELQASAGNTDLFEVPVYAGNKATHQLTDVGAVALARSEHLVGLRRLNLASNGIGLAGVRALIAAPWRLEELDLSNNALEDAAVLAIAGAAELSGVKRLLLGGGQYGARALEALAKSKTLTSLESIHFTGTPFGSEGLARFLKSLQLPKLTALTLEDTQLGDDGALAIASSKSSTRFTSLELGHNKVTQVGVFALADSPHLVNLERLLLNDAWLGKKAVVEHLAASPTLAKCRIYVKGSLLGRAKPKAVKAPAKKPKKKK